MTDQKLADLLRTAVDGDPLPPIDPGQVAGRGERSLRRRRRLAVAAAGAATVAAVGLTTVGLGSLGRGDADGGPGPAATSATTSKAPSTAGSGEFTPLPGVPDGEEAIALTTAEMLRRCALRYPQYRDEKAIEMGRPVVGSDVIYPLRIGQRPKHCIVPGDSRPSAKLLREAMANPMPTDQRAMLRNCSVLMWHDLTGWRVVATDREPGYLLNVVALSPTGHHALNCSLTADLIAREQPGARNRDIPSTDGVGNNAIYPVDPQQKRTPATSIAGGAFSQGSAICKGSECIGFLYDTMGRVPSTVARIKLTAPNGRSHEIRVNDGWFALAWGDRVPNSSAELTVTAYDAQGKRLR